VNAARRLLIRNDSDTVEMTREVMDEVSQQAVRAATIVRRLRDFLTRGETEKQGVGVTKMVEEATELALIGSEALGVKVTYGFDPRAQTAFVNRVQIQQVLGNLIRNALEAMVGLVPRELTVLTAMVDKETIEISVADIGPGIVDSIRAHLFQPFVSSKRDGMGLGLSICRTIVEAHGGRIWAEANPTGGTVLRFTLATSPSSGASNAERADSPRRR
jgi:two-component system sensor kinase FixL